MKHQQDFRDSLSRVASCIATEMGKDAMGYMAKGAIMSMSSSSIDDLMERLSDKTHVYWKKPPFMSKLPERIHLTRDQVLGYLGPLAASYPIMTSLIPETLTLTEDTMSRIAYDIDMIIWSCIKFIDYQRSPKIVDGVKRYTKDYLSHIKLSEIIGESGRKYPITMI